METTMRVELALFDGDALLESGHIRVGREQQTTAFRLFQAHHILGTDSAEIVLDGFAEGAKIRRAALDMPIHDSEDWESIELGAYTLGFRSRVEA
jgi:hypothetical protein